MDDMVIILGGVIGWIFAFASIGINFLIHQENKNLKLKPNIDLSLQLGREHNNLIEFRVKNYGPGIARKIHFKIKEGGDFITTSGDKFENLPIIMMGIDSLGPDENRWFVITNLSEHYVEKKMDVQFKIEITYEDEKGGKYTPTQFSIPLKVFHGLRYPLSQQLVSYTRQDITGATPHYSDSSNNQY
jgi:hypothetical protein